MRRTFHSLLILSGLFLVQQESWGRDWRVNQIPNGQTFSCLNCHLTSEGGGAVNVFGESVEGVVGVGSSDAFWSRALAYKDSDGDGFTDGEELGDRDGDGKIDSNTAEITNPGDSSSFPSSVTRWVFNTAGAEGRLGPTLSQVEAAYDQTSLSGKVAVETQGIQQWSVPYTGRYRIIAYGARGGRPKDVDDKLRGKGVVWQGDFDFLKDQKLNIVVGQEGIAKPGGNAVNGGGTGGGGKM